MNTSCAWPGNCAKDSTRIRSIRPNICATLFFPTLTRGSTFYASTRTYKVVLDMHGWGEVSARLNEKAAKGDWGGMAQEITDEMLDTYAVVGSYDDIAEK